MSPTPTTGDIWEFHQYKSVEPLTVLLGKLIESDVDGMCFSAVAFDMSSLKHVYIFKRHMKFWRKLA